MGSNDEDDDDIYSNLPGFKYHETLDKLQAANKSLQARVTELEEEVEKLTKENAEYRDQCSKLSTNISSIIKTAQTEIKRKDSRISELNKEVISLKTRSYRFRRKRSFESSNENDNGIEKGKTNDNRKSPIKKKRISTEPSFNVELNNYYCSPINKEEEPAKIHEKENKPAQVPNIQCHTVYSQRMFKKIYNTEAVKPVITDITTASEVVADTPMHSPNGATNKVNLTQLSELNNKPAKSNLDSSNNCITKPAPVSELLASKQVPNNQSRTEQNNILKLFNKIDTAQSLPEKKLEGSSIETKQKNISDSHSENISPSHIPNNLKELSTDIPVNELKSIMSNVMTLNKMKDCQDKKLSDDLILNPNGKKPQDSLKFESDTINNNEKPMKPLLGKSDNIIDKFGLKFLRPGKSTFSPISCQWNDVLQRKENEKHMNQKQKQSSPSPEKSNEKADLMEALFGSPLKWADNSEDVKEAKEVPKLNPPLTAYEDSCSAQIENSKFEKINVRETYIKTTVQKNEKGLAASPRRPGITQTPFEQIKSDGKITNFSSLIHIETGEKSYNMTSLSVKIDQTSASDKHTSRTFVTSPKYNDSILGQFDDTTQLISALARDHSKISPIHTPIKESKTELVSSPENIDKEKHDNFNRKSVKTPPLTKVSPELRKTEKKTILLDEPINILCPRKTPRTVRTKKPPSPKKDSHTSSEGLSISNNETALNDRKVSKDIHDSSLPKVQNSISASVHCAKVLLSTDEVTEKVYSSKDSENCKNHIREDCKLKTKMLEERKSTDRTRNVKHKDHSDFTIKSPVIQTEPDVEKTSSKKMFSHGSSEKKENLPFKFKREERKYTFKRPNISYYSSHRRQNCHFRHSSVERKLLKDRRHSSCIRNTPVRSVRKRTDHEPRYGKSNRPLNSEARANKYDSDRDKAFTSTTDRGHKKPSKCPSNSDKSHPRTPTVQSDSENCRPKSHPRTPTVQSDSENCQPKSQSRTPTVQSGTENGRPRSSPFTPDAQVTKTTYIKRSSKKIEWSATTTDVVSTKPAETAAQKTETKMKWFLQPIDFNVSSPLYSSKKSNIDTKTDPENANLPDYCENNAALKFNTDTIAGNSSTPEKNLKSPSIVIIPRKRPAKFGVSQMSINHCLKVIEP